MAVRLCQIAVSHWGGISSAYYQINLLRVPPYRFASLVYTWAIERVEHGKLPEWIEELHSLLEWQDADSEAAIDLESESFMNMMAKGG